MRSSIFAKFVRGFKFKSHVVWPAAITIPMILMYYSTSSMLQDVVAPPLVGTRHGYLWGFGLLSVVEIILLVCVIFYGLRCLFGGKNIVSAIICFLLLLMSAFFLSEELGFGVTAVEQFTSQQGQLARTAWEDYVPGEEPPSAEQVAGLIKLTGMSLIMGGFAFFAIVLGGSRNRTVRLVRPNIYVVLTAALTAIMYSLALMLHENGFGTINGVTGALDHSNSEFIQVNVYWLFLVYLAILHERIVIRNES